MPPSSRWTLRLDRRGCESELQRLAVGNPGGFGAQDATSGLQTGAFGRANTFSNVHDDAYSQTMMAAAGEVDATKRKQRYSRINDILLENCFTMPLSSLLQMSLSTKSTALFATGLEVA